MGGACGYSKNRIIQQIIHGFNKAPKRMKHPLIVGHNWDTQTSERCVNEPLHYIFYSGLPSMSMGKCADLRSLSRLDRAKLVRELSQGLTLYWLSQMHTLVRQTRRSPTRLALPTSYQQCSGGGAPGSFKGLFWNLSFSKNETFPRFAPENLASCDFWWFYSTFTLKVISIVSQHGIYVSLLVSLLFLHNRDRRVAPVFVQRNEGRLDTKSSTTLYVSCGGRNTRQALHLNVIELVLITFDETNCHTT